MHTGGGGGGGGGMLAPVRDPDQLCARDIDRWTIGKAH